MDSSGSSNRSGGAGAFLVFHPRYCVCFFAVILSALCAFATAGMLGLSIFFQDVALSSSYRCLGFLGLVYAGLLAYFNFMLVRGRPGWVWGNVVLLLGCLFCSLPALEYRPDKLTYVMAVFSPLIGLYLLGSGRHRELRLMLAESGLPKRK